MKTSTAPKKIFPQKGQGLVEYALLFGFVGAIAAFIFFNGGLGDSIKNVFGAADDNLSVAIGYTASADDGETSFDYETLTAEDITPPTYKTLNWQEIIFGVPGMYGTVMNSDTADKALVSEMNLFAQISAMVEDHLASTNASDGLKDWETFLSTMESLQARNNFRSSYVRGEETFVIQRLGNSNTVQARYSDGKEVVYWRLSPDANNVMQIETNSTKSFSEFMSPIAYTGGWSKST